MAHHQRTICTPRGGEVIVHQALSSPVPVSLSPCREGLGEAR
jgi:hypothetical protein